MALTGESVRVNLKKDYAQLVTEGQQNGYASVIIEGKENAITLPKGESQINVAHPTLPYVLNAQRFSTLDDKERRSFLFGLMGIKAGGAEVSKRLSAKSCDATKSETILPLLRAGFDAAMKEAQDRARELKAVWKSLTGGETYGEKKANSFALPKQIVDEAKLVQARHDLVEIDKQLEIATQNHAIAKARLENAQKQSTIIAALREHSGKYARIADKLNRDEAELKEWEAKVEQTRVQAGMKLAQTTAPESCPHCCGMVLVKGGHLEIWQEETLPHYDHEASAMLPQYEHSLKVAQNAVANGKRDLEVANIAAKTLQAIDDDAHSVPVVDLEALQTEIGALKHSRTNQQSAIRLLEDAQRHAGEVDRKNADAKQTHISIGQWEAIAAALAPDGIPGDMLNDALQPVNDRLATSSNIAQWMRINIGRDMSIYAAEEGAPPRDYALLSESEKWRCDAMIAEAVSHLSGLKLLVLDRFDVLDMAGREDLLCWLDDLVDEKEIDTAILFGTLKAIPANLPASIEAHWLENGCCGQIREAA